MDERQERIGQNEALYRSINDRLERLNETFASITNTFDIVCECGDLTCSEQMTVPAQDYERVRSDSALFIVRPGHVSPDVERVVEEHGEYHVLRKRAGDPAELASALDERDS